jgi:hypothetical protein
MSLHGPPRCPLRYRAPSVGFYDAGAIGVTSVNEDLHFGVALIEPVREIRANSNNGIDFLL